MDGDGGEHHRRAVTSCCRVFPRSPKWGERRPQTQRRASYKTSTNHEALLSHEFLRYVGPPNLHDATIERLEHEGSALRVRIRADDGQVISAEFRGVTQVLATAAEGMMLYAVAEMRSDGPQRRFVFANWHDPGEEGIERQLEVMAEDVHFRSERPWWKFW